MKAIGDLNGVEFHNVIRTSNLSRAVRDITALGAAEGSGLGTSATVIVSEATHALVEFQREGCVARHLYVATR